MVFLMILLLMILLLYPLYKNSKIPRVLEVTYLRNDLINNKEKNTISLPILNLDFPNCTTYPDYDLSFTPFVN